MSILFTPLQDSMIENNQEEVRRHCETRIALERVQAALAAVTRERDIAVRALVKAKEAIEATGYLASYDATVNDGGLQANTDKAIRLAIEVHADVCWALESFIE